MARHWLGIDIGGTFTDFALFDTRTGEVIGLKVPSTPHEFAEAVRVGLERLADEHRVDLREIGTIVHGTTIAVNTLIQRTALVEGEVGERAADVDAESHARRRSRKDFVAASSTARSSASSVPVSTTP